MLKVFSPFNVIFVVNSVQNNSRHIIDRHKHPEEKSLCSLYSKPILSGNLKRIGFQDLSSLNAGQKYCRCSKVTFLKLPFVNEIFVLFMFAWPLNI